MTITRRSFLLSSAAIVAGAALPVTSLGNPVVRYRFEAADNDFTEGTGRLSTFRLVSKFHRDYKLMYLRLV